MKNRNLLHFITIISIVLTLSFGIPMLVFLSKNSWQLNNLTTSLLVCTCVCGIINVIFSVVNFVVLIMKIKEVDEDWRDYAIFVCCPVLYPIFIAWIALLKPWHALCAFFFIFTVLYIVFEVNSFSDFGMLIPLVGMYVFASFKVKDAIDGDPEDAIDWIVLFMSVPAILAFLGTCNFMSILPDFSSKSSEGKEETTYHIFVDGSERKLKEEGYTSAMDGTKSYKDDLGDRWESKDEQTFIKKD